MKKFLLATTAAVTLASSANAATFVGTRTVGGSTAQLSITTDDSLGALGFANILDWNIFLDNGTSSFTLDSGNSSYNQSGAGLFATATELTFDFDGAGGGFAFFEAGSSNLYCITIAPTNCGGVSGEQIRIGGANEAFVDSGVQVIASVAAAVPEPATWAFMIFGFGAIGGALRRSRKANVKVSYA